MEDKVHDLIHLITEKFQRIEAILDELKEDFTKIAIEYYKDTPDTDNKSKSM